MASALLRDGWCSRGWRCSSNSRCRGCVVLGTGACRFVKLLGVEAGVVLRLRSAMGSCCEASKSDALSFARSSP